MQAEALINTALRTSIRFTNQFKGMSIANVGDHREVLDAIVAGDLDNAQAAMAGIPCEVMKLIEAVRRLAIPATN